MAGPYISHGPTTVATSYVSTAEALSSLNMVPGTEGPRMAQRTPWGVKLSGCLRCEAIKGSHFASVAGFQRYLDLVCPRPQRPAD